MTGQGQGPPAIDGLLLVDKGGGLTSHDLVNQVRRIAGQKRVGHAGTLDPMATGLMAILLGSATRLEPWLVKSRKSYLATVRLGLSTDSLDVTGQTLSEWPGPWPGPSEAALALGALEGPGLQVPPAISAIKVAGRTAYREARAGRPVELPPRAVTAYSLRLLDYRPPLLTLEAQVSSGYYVRSLARDLGLALGLGGGALSALRRLSIGDFGLDGALTLPSSREDLLARVMPPRQALGHLPELELPTEALRRLCSGLGLPAPPQAATGLHKIIAPCGRLAALAENLLPGDDDASHGKPRGPFLRPLRVFMPAASWPGANTEQGRDQRCPSPQRKPSSL
ncbi:MAG: tRNA pseudouridine(55) synthase TruB [Deltaproteobacteria bacterium]|nr:tRNA pseudouridine(55) synthase TruB [Deltaproteobacteria bacterium]